MRRTILLFLSVFALSSCGVPALYYWGGTQNGATTYENLAYKDYKTQTPDVICKLICTYEKIVTTPTGTRQVPPPGICAEYGYLLLQPETAQIFLTTATSQQKSAFKGNDYESLFLERGKEMLQKELEYYPESRVFVEPLIKKLVQ